MTKKTKPKFKKCISCLENNVAPNPIDGRCPQCRGERPIKSFKTKRKSRRRVK